MFQKENWGTTQRDLIKIIKVVRPRGVNCWMPQALTVMCTERTFHLPGGPGTFLCYCAKPKLNHSLVQHLFLGWAICSHIPHLPLPPCFNTSAPLPSLLHTIVSGLNTGVLEAITAPCKENMMHGSSLVVCHYYGNDSLLPFWSHLLSRTWMDIGVRKFVLAMGFVFSKAR